MVLDAPSLKDYLEQVLQGDVGVLNWMSYHICVELEGRERDRVEKWAASLEPSLSQLQYGLQ